MKDNATLHKSSSVRRLTPLDKQEIDFTVQKPMTKKASVSLIKVASRGALKEATNIQSLKHQK